MRIAKRETGQDLVEFALLAPILFFVLFGIVEFGVAVWRYNTVSNAAREGARAALVYPPEEREEQAQNVAVRLAQGTGVNITVDDVEYAAGTFVVGEGDPARVLDTVAVTVTFTHTSVTGLFPDIGLSASSSMLVE